MTLNRRRFLRGAAGAALALPALELFSTTARAGSASQRLLVYMMPNGRRPEWWVPSAGAGGLTFPGPAAALQPFASRTLSLVDLDNNAARRSPGAAHAMGTGTIMTGVRVPDLVGLKNGVSSDQLIANTIGQSSRFKSLQWSAGEPGPCDVGGASCAYTQSISWAGAGQPLIPTINPKGAFDRLFGSSVDGLTGPEGERRARSLGSVVDHVREDARSLEARLGQGDKRRLEEYFTALLELERKLEPVALSETCEVPDAPGGSLGYPERVAAFHDLIRLAFVCDQTRVLSFMIEFGLSGRSHPFIDAPGAHHGLTHDGSGQGFQRLERLERWHAQQLAALLQLLQSTSTATGTLLDETLVLVIPDMGAGASHDHGHNCPLLIGGNGVVRTDNRRLNFGGTTTLANLHVTLLQAFGVQGNFGPTGAIFGDDGTAVLPGVLA